MNGGLRDPFADRSRVRPAASQQLQRNVDFENQTTTSDLDVWTSGGQDFWKVYLTE